MNTHSPKYLNYVEIYDYEKYAVLSERERNLVFTVKEERKKLVELREELAKFENRWYRLVDTWTNFAITTLVTLGLLGLCFVIPFLVFKGAKLATY